MLWQMWWVGEGAEAWQVGRCCFVSCLAAVARRVVTFVVVAVVGKETVRIEMVAWEMVDRV